jgi:biofilm PGA synthesis N-glycosyltransferase PgaC
VDLERVVLVASGCTDSTVARARESAAGDPRFQVVEQAVREGKAAAVTAFLGAAGGADLLVLAGADTRIEPGALEALLSPFDDPAVGMTGGRPLPVNDPGTAMGRVVRLLWALHHAVALESPKLGELVAFRPLFAALPRDTAVDEAAIEALVRGRGLRLAYAPEARVAMKGPSTVRDFLAQRRRIHSGHLRLRRTSGHAVSTLSLGAVVRALRATRGEFSWTTMAWAVMLEAAARLLGVWDARTGGREHAVWERIPSTKDLRP